MFVANKYNIKTYSGLKKELEPVTNFLISAFFYLINMDVWVSLCVPRLIL
jgi:hypothetical protein